MIFKTSIRDNITRVEISIYLTRVLIKWMDALLLRWNSNLSIYSYPCQRINRITCCRRLNIYCDDMLTTKCKTRNKKYPKVNKQQTFWTNRSSHFTRQPVESMTTQENTQSKRYFHHTRTNLHQYPKCKLPTVCVKWNFHKKSSDCWLCTNLIVAKQIEESQERGCLGWGSSGVNACLGHSLVPHKPRRMLEWQNRWGPSVLETSRPPPPPITNAPHKIPQRGTYTLLIR